MSKKLPNIDDEESIDTPSGEKLSAKYKESFMYISFKDRVPKILCSIIDHIYRNRKDIGERYGREKALDVIKRVTEGISQLRYELETNKELSELTDDLPDVGHWNDYRAIEIEATQTPPRYYYASGLYAECYIYRRIAECVKSASTDCSSFAGFDWFQFQKRATFFATLPQMKRTAVELNAVDVGKLNRDELKNHFSVLLRNALWANKFDLSISAGAAISLETLKGVDRNVLADDSDAIWDLLRSRDESTVVDIVMDNCGYEFFTDLCLAHFLLKSNVAKKIRFRVKKFPWFVSDTTEEDFLWSLEHFKQHEELNELATTWRNFITIDKSWTIHSDAFWTYPNPYSDMESVDPKLYKELGEAKLVIFKGDLNFRKLVGDILRPPTTSFKDSLDGFHPTAVASIRAMKADVVAGLAKGVAEKTASEDPEWLHQGNWGTICLSD